MEIEEICCSLSAIIIETDETHPEYTLFSEFLEYANQITVDLTYKCDVMKTRSTKVPVTLFRI